MLIYNFEISNGNNLFPLDNFTNDLVEKLASNYSSLNTTNCTEYINKTSDIYKMIMYSGKRFNDLGNFDNCISNETLNFAFSVLRFIRNKAALKNDQTDSNITKKFLNLTKMLYGLCFPKECEYLIKNGNLSLFIDNTISIMGGISEITNISIYNSEINPPKNEATYNIFIILVLLLVILLIIKIISSFIVKLVFTNKNESQATKIYEEEEENEEEEQEDEDKNEAEKINKNKDESKLKQNLFTKTAPIENNNKNKNLNFRENSIIKNIFSSLDITQSLKYLATKKNKYYDSTNLELLFFFRAIALFFMVYAHNFFSMTKTPVPNLADEENYSSLTIIILKFSTFCTVLYIGLEGFEASFKLFSCIKKDIIIRQENQINIRITVILKFLLYMLPSIFVLIFCVFTMGVEIKDYSYFMNEYFNYNVNPMLQYFTDDVYNRTCINEPILFIRPFSLLYYHYTGMNGYGEYNRGIDNCYKYVDISYNIFFCYIILLFVVYFAIKIKKKYFEIVFVIIILSGAIIYVFIFLNINGDYTEFQNFSLDFLLGENYSYKYTHLFLCYYFYGAIAGIIYFYYIDALSRKPLSSFNDYLPFEYCFKIVKKLDSLKFVFQVCISLVCLAIIVLLNIWFYIKIKTDDSSILFDIQNEIYKIIDLYEKQIFLVCTLIIILILLFNTGSYKAFKTFYSNLAFVFVGRSSHFMFFIMDFIISMFYCLYNFVIYFDLMSTLIYTIGQFFLCLFISVILNILVEQPIKIVIKICFGSKDNNKESANNIEKTNFYKIN